MKDKKAVLSLLFTVLPVYACSIFLSYTVPLHVEDYGFSVTITSVLILGNYLLSAYAGPYCTEKLLSKVSADKTAWIYMLLTAIMVVLYAVFPSMSMLIALVLACGVLDSFGLTALIASFTQKRSSDAYSDNAALVAFYLVSRIGQTVGPILISSTGSIAILGILLLVGLGVSIVFGGRKEKL